MLPTLCQVVVAIVIINVINASSPDVDVKKRHCESEVEDVELLQRVNSATAQYRYKQLNKQRAEIGESTQHDGKSATKFDKTHAGVELALRSEVPKPQLKWFVVAAAVVLIVILSGILAYCHLASQSTGSEVSPRDPNIVDGDDNRWLVLVNFSLHGVCNGFLWVNFSSISGIVASALGANLAEINELYSASFAAAVLGIVVGMYCLDRWEWVMYLIGTTLTIAAAWLRIAAVWQSSVRLAFLSSTLVGLPIGILFPGMAKIPSQWFAIGKEQAFASAVACQSTMFGWALGSIVVPVLVDSPTSLLAFLHVQAIVASLCLPAFFFCHVTKEGKTGQAMETEPCSSGPEAPKDDVKQVEDSIETDEVKPAMDAKPLKSSAETKPAGEPQPDEQATPTADAPMDEAKLVENAKATEEAKQPAEKTNPFEHAKPAEETNRIEDAKSAGEAELVEEGKPADEGKPVEETRAAQKATPTEDTKRARDADAEDAKPIEDMEAAEGMPPSTGIDVTKAFHQHQRISSGPFHEIVTDSAAPRNLIRDQRFIMLFIGCGLSQGIAYTIPGLVEHTFSNAGRSPWTGFIYIVMGNAMGMVLGTQAPSHRDALVVALLWGATLSLWSLQFVYWFGDWLNDEDRYSLYISLMSAVGACSMGSLNVVLPIVCSAAAPTSKTFSGGFVMLFSLVVASILASLSTGRQFFLCAATMLVATMCMTFTPPKANVV